MSTYYTCAVCGMSYDNGEPGERHESWCEKVSEVLSERAFQDAELHVSARRWRGKDPCCGRAGRKITLTPTETGWEAYGTDEGRRVTEIFSGATPDEAVAALVEKR